ncbi:MAG: radical SAM/SPASM domain-containing protein [Planctomycetota bacterium]|jgi:radical SAM protein with 4Fe4S-binding SPASM domain
MGRLQQIQDPRLLHQKSGEALDRGDLESAKQNLEQAFYYGLEPGAAGSLIELAERFAASESWKEAEELLLEALRIAPGLERAQALLEDLHKEPERFCDIKPYDSDERIEMKKRDSVIAGTPTMQLFLELTNRCNGSCQTCLHRTMQRCQGIMDFDLFKKIVDESVETLYLEMVHLYGVGEVFMIPNAFDYFDYAARQYSARGIRTALITNGERITDIPGHVSEIDISFNAGRKETYERITGMSFDRTKQNIWRLDREGQLDSRCNIHMLVFEDNQDEVEDFKRLFAYTCANLVLAYKYDNQCGEIEDKTVAGFQQDRKIPCHYVRKVMNIAWNGDVILCPHDFEGRVNYGNAGEMTLEEIWQSPCHAEMLKAHAACRFEGLCEKCNYNLPIDDQNRSISKAERIELRKRHADFAWNEMIQCPFSADCEIRKSYLENIDTLESGDDPLIAVCSTDWRFYGLDTVMDRARHPDCPGLERLRAQLDDTRISWESPTFGPSGYAFAARGYMLGLDDLGTRVRTQPIWADCIVESRD